MTKTTKIAASVLAAGAVAFSLVPQSAQANPITGTVSFSGSVTAYENTTGTGASSADFTQDHSLVLTGVTVNTPPAPTGTFMGLAGRGVDFSSSNPLQYNPVGSPPVPSPGILWQINGTTLTFTITTLVQTMLTPLNLTLFGTGTLSDGNPADTVTGTWNAAFTEATTGGNVTFSFGSSSAATVPDGGTSLMFLGLGLTALAAFAQFRKQVA